MISLNTPCKPEPPSRLLTYNDSILLLGSCFAEHLVAKANEIKFTTYSNPYGIIYQPNLLFDSVHDVFDHEKSIDHLFQKHNQWLSWKHHSRIVGNSKQDLEQLLLNLKNQFYTQLKSVSVLSFTLGTSWIYRLKSNQIGVANCHKQPASLFNKELLSVDEMFDSFERMYKTLERHGLQCQIKFTISPVRHIKDGLFENNVSKGRLFDLVHRIRKHYPNVWYFPAYEIVFDELRDYRFYADDLLHPSSKAVDIIWDRFHSIYFHPNELKDRISCIRIRQFCEHRILQSINDSYVQTCQKLLEEINTLQKKYPHQDWESERGYLQTTLINYGN